MSTAPNKAKRAQINREREMIMEFLADYQQRTFTEIIEATGLDERTLQNRMTYLRGDGKVEFIERFQVGPSIYQKAAEKGEVLLPPHMRDYPPLYLHMGGWACVGVVA